MFNFLKKPKYRIMQDQVTKKYYVEKYILCGNNYLGILTYKCLKLKKDFNGHEEWTDKVIPNTIYFDTIEQAEAKIAEFKAEEEKKELLKNPKIIKYL